MVPKIPSCHYMLLMYPSRRESLRSLFHIHVRACIITTATGRQPICSYIIIIIIITIIINLHSTMKYLWVFIQIGETFE